MNAERYSRQVRFAGLGLEGQERLQAARVLLLGCGALGSVLAEILVRAGVGHLTLIDRDFVEPSNLQRQSLYDEDDARRALPKAVAAEARLQRLNGDARLEARVTDLDAGNVSAQLAGHDLVLDGSDNFETRFVLNDACLQAGLPWIYGACVGAHGVALAVRPRRTPCLRCVLGELPAPGGPTCETAGIIAPAVHAVAAVQAAEALKLLAGRETALLRGLLLLDLWHGTFEVLDFAGREPWCVACKQQRYPALESPETAAAVLCGRDAVQVRAPQGTRLALDELAARLAVAGPVRTNDHLLRFQAPEAELVVFRDGRAIVKGVSDAGRARALYARYVGS